MKEKLLNILSISVVFGTILALLVMATINQGLSSILIAVAVIVGILIFVSALGRTVDVLATWFEDYDKR